MKRMLKTTTMTMTMNRQSIPTTTNSMVLLLLYCCLLYFLSIMIRVEIIGVEAAAAATAAFDGGQEDAIEEDKVDDDDDILLISNLIEWLKSNGAYINDDVEVRQIPIPTTTPTTNTNNKLSGIFAKVDIPKGKIICTIPYDLIIKPNIYSKLQQGTYCSTVSTVYDSISKKPELQNPYERYLATRTRNHLPQFWTLDGQRILDELIGLSIRGEEFIFKKKKKKRFNNKKKKKEKKKKKKKKRNNKDDWVGHYFKQCLNINLDDYEEKKDSEDYYYDESMILLEYLNDDYLMNSIMIVYTRGEGPNLEHIIPFHDINNHGNGNKNWNVDISDPRRLLLSKNNIQKQYSIYAKRNIIAGEQLMHSYNQCKWCNTQYTNPFDENSFFVTAQILLWYGFVEDYPQRYIIPSARLFFDIDYNTTTNTTTTNNNNDHDNNHDHDDIDIAAFADGDDDEKLLIESLDVNFIVPPTNRSISYLIKTIRKLDEFKQQYLIVSDTTTTTTTIPEIEINTIRQFHQSIVIAFKAALRQGQQQPSLDDDKVWSLGNNEWYWEEYDQKGKWYWEDREINIDAGDDGGIDDRFEL